MKKTIFFVATFAAILTSCSNSELAGVASVSKGTTASITAYVASNYPDTKIYTTSTSGTSVIATLNTGEQLTFSSDGKLMSYTNNFSLGLKADSLAIDPNDTIDGPGHGGPGHGGPGQPGGNKGGGPGHGGPKGNGGPNGFGGGPGCGGPNGPGYGGPIDSTHVDGNQKPGHKRHFNNEIVVDSLPTVVNVYITTNYLAYTVIHAEIDTICSGAVTEVMVCTKGNEPVKLVFDASGTYLFKGERIKYADVPVAVSAAVTADYATYTVAGRAEKFTLADGSLQYKVHLFLGKVHKTVTLTADGTIVCEK